MTRKKHQLGPLDALTGFHMRRAYGVFRRDFDRAVEGLGVRQVSLGVLSVISANPGIKQGAVGTILDIQRANMVSLIGELAEAGLVNRGEDPTDRRAIALSLTQAGQDLLDASLDRIDTHEAKLLTGFTAQERQQLTTMLDRVAANGNAED
ncbi:MarR family winged helix-turn-helix transcriptional regulator [Croceicoccus bisphenolivorans]|uniref:MarR family winged helix-turn-helix transcriptional regulator n=1 Tax=Croceicoccus bisphenolivorans TaxID=1783232 RepID=UPI00082F99C4|nr:MarR family transcriptional regulator [Croceicoccus bisphenolivorans]